MFLPIGRVISEWQFKQRPGFLKLHFPPFAAGGKRKPPDFRSRSSRSDEMTVAGRIYPPVWILEKARVAERRLNEILGTGFNRRSVTKRLIGTGSTG
jgi:hypothetical protein